MKKANSNPPVLLNFPSRETLLSANSEIIVQLQARLSAKRFRVQEGDNIKLAYIRVFIQALQIQNSILRDVELDDIKKRLETLEIPQNEKYRASKPYSSPFDSIQYEDT